VNMFASLWMAGRGGDDLPSFAVVFFSPLFISPLARPLARPSLFFSHTAAEGCLPSAQPLIYIVFFDSRVAMFGLTSDL